MRFETTAVARMIDRTMLNIASLVLAGAGLLTVLTKFNVPEINMLFLGSNPFAIKTDVIESTMSWLFTGLALFGLLLQLLAEIFSDRLPPRLYGGCTYIVVSAVSVIAALFLVLALTTIGNRIAKRQWLPT